MFITLSASSQVKTMDSHIRLHNGVRLGLSTDSVYRIKEHALWIANKKYDLVKTIFMVTNSCQSFKIEALNTTLETDGAIFVLRGEGPHTAIKMKSGKLRILKENWVVILSAGHAAVIDSQGNIHMKG